MKIVMLRLEIEDSELEQARRLYAEEHGGREAPSDAAAVARDIQAFCYDDGGMHGSFQVLSVEDGGPGAAT